MKYRLMTAALALTLAGACFPDVEEGKPKATVAEPTAAQAPAPASQEAPQTHKFAVDAKQSRIAAVGAKVSAKHDIAFDKWTGTLTVADGQLSGVDIEIQMTSLRADEEKLTHHLKSPDFFEVDKFPTATFAATTIVAQPGADGATHVVSGNLAMHGVSKQISFPATINVSGDAASAKADFVINRKDFGIEYPGMPDDLIKDEVALSIKLVSGDRKV